MSNHSPNTKIKPLTAAIDENNHLIIGGCDTVKLAQLFGTPLYVIDEATIRQAIASLKQGLNDYPQSKLLYAGKAFLCLAMCRLIDNLGLGLDVVSGGELSTALAANFPADQIYMHGNNKSKEEICLCLSAGDVKIVIDNESELAAVAEIANALGKKAKILLRMTPGVIPDTHHYIATGHNDSKFGIPLGRLPAIIEYLPSLPKSVELVGLHAHIGSQSRDIEPYLDIVEIMAQCLSEVKTRFDKEFDELDLGGGLAISYVDEDKPSSLFQWANQISQQVIQSFQKRQLQLPTLVLEPGRAIVGPAGITLYQAGHAKELPTGVHYIAVDGGMADNPRPITYQARYTACVANRMVDQKTAKPMTIVGKYCESGDIIIKDAHLTARTGDLIAIFGTGAYNYSMASNYNRTGRPACVLVHDGQADIIIERETNLDLLRQDRVPERLLAGKGKIS